MNGQGERGLSQPGGLGTRGCGDKHGDEGEAVGGGRFQSCVLYEKSDFLCVCVCVQESLQVLVKTYGAPRNIHNKQLGSNAPSGGVPCSPQEVRRCLLS